MVGRGVRFPRSRLITLLSNLKKKLIMEYSVKKTAEIARRYGYKIEMVVVTRIGRGRAFLSASEPFLRSPHPRHFTSSIRSLDYVERMMNEEGGER